MSTLNVKTLQTLDGSFSVDVEDILSSTGEISSSNITNTANDTSRTLDVILGDVINVKNYGAKGDFSTDDTAAIKAALTDASSYSDRGGVVYLPAGIYNISEMLTIPEYVTLMGAGRYSTMLRCTEGGSIVSSIINMENDYSTLRGINVVYSSGQTSVGNCILTTGASNTLEDFNCSAGYNGVWWYNGSATKMLNFNISDCNYTGVLIGESATGFSNDLIMDDFFIIANDTSKFSLGAIRVIGRVEALFASNFDLIGSTYPITTSAGSTNGLRFSSFINGFFDSAINPASFAGVNNTTFTDCWFSQRSSGAQFSACFNIEIKGARVWNNDAQGFIFLSSCHNITCSGVFGNNNVAAGTGVQDIYIDGSCSQMTFHNITGYEAGSTNYLVYVGSGASYITLRDIKITERSSGYITLAGSNTSLVVDGVDGFITKASGTSSIAASGTSVSVTHGLSITPGLKNIIITPNGATASNLYVSAVSSTTFTVSTSTANTGSAAFAWRADVSQS